MCTVKRGQAIRRGRITFRCIATKSQVQRRFHQYGSRSSKYCYFLLICRVGAVASGSCRDDCLKPDRFVFCQIWLLYAYKESSRKLTQELNKGRRCYVGLAREDQGKSDSASGQVRAGTLDQTATVLLVLCHVKANINYFLFGKRANTT